MGDVGDHLLDRLLLRPDPLVVPKQDLIQPLQLIIQLRRQGIRFQIELHVPFAVHHAVDAAAELLRKNGEPPADEEQKEQAGKKAEDREGDGRAPDRGILRPRKQQGEEAPGKDHVSRARARICRPKGQGFFHVFSPTHR